jgi:hypothetical protein
MRVTLRAILAIVLVASFTCSAAAQGSLLSPEETQIIEKAREVTLEYTANLPNFICIETVRRFELQKGSQTWKLLDTMTVDVAFSDKGERYNLLTINGKPTRKKFKDIDGTMSGGDFGGVLWMIFLPESQAKFQFERPADVRGRPTLVFSYRIEQDHSHFGLNSNRHHIIAAFGGLVYVDLETNRVLKSTFVASGIPAKFPITAFSEEIDYGFAEISGQQVFLPLQAQLNATTDGRQTRNEIEFGDYRKFSSEAILKFEP